MGLLSGIGKVLFGDPTKDIRRGRDEEMRFRQQGLDYLKEFNQPLLQARNQALPLLQGFYTGDQVAQQQMIDSVQASPFYQQMLQTGQEGVLDRAGAMGLTRSGNTAQDLSRSNQAVLQGLLGQRLSGLQGLANLPVSASGVTNQLNSMGQTMSQARIAQAQAEQDLAGQIFDGAMSIAKLPGVM